MGIIVKDRAGHSRPAGAIILKFIARHFHIVEYTVNSVVTRLAKLLALSLATAVIETVSLQVNLRARSPVSDKLRGRNSVASSALLYSSRYKRWNLMNTFILVSYSDTGEKNYCCSICDKAFARRHDMLRHERTVHKNDDTRKSGAKQSKSDQLPKMMPSPNFWITLNKDHCMALYKNR